MKVFQQMLRADASQLQMTRCWRGTFSWQSDVPTSKSDSGNFKDKNCSGRVLTLGPGPSPALLVKGGDVFLTS